MSDKAKWPRERALSVGNDLLASLAPSCLRIEIAGSLRRQKERVGDVELLFVPKIETVKLDLLATTEQPATEGAVNWLERAGIIAKRPNARGSFTWGPLNKLAIDTATGIPVDLFVTTLDCWFVSLVIRTGPKEFNIRLIQSAARRGIKVHAYGGLERGHETIYPASEREMLEICGVPWAEPKDRK